MSYKIKITSSKDRINYEKYINEIIILDREIFNLKTKQNTLIDKVHKIEKKYKKTK